MHSARRSLSAARRSACNPAAGVCAAEVARQSNSQRARKGAPAAGAFLKAGAALLVAAVALLAAGGGAVHATQGAAGGENHGLDPPALYGELRNARPEPAGRISGGSLRVDRFELTFTDGDLYLTPPVAGQTLIAVYLGRGTVRAWPPDGVELQQLRKLTDDDALDEEFEQVVFWFTGDFGDRLRALAGGPPGREANKAVDLLEDRREAQFEGPLLNPDSRVLLDLWDLAAEPAPDAGDRPYFLADIDRRRGDWFSIEIEPRRLEEVAVRRFDGRHRVLDTWMRFHALDDFEPETVEPALGGFPRDPDVEGPIDPDDDRRRRDAWSFRDYGLSPRPLLPDHERWRPRVAVSRADVDLALEENGNAVASVALAVEPLETLAAVRFDISALADVTDVRWRPGVPAGVDDVLNTPLLAAGAGGDGGAGAARGQSAGEPPAPDTPARLTGEPVHYVQEKDNRRLDEDRYEPSLTVLLPRPVAAGERFVLEVAYEGELLEHPPNTISYLIKDSIGWIPRHPHNRKRRFRLTFRTPDSYRVASGGEFLGERVDDGTRIAQWAIDQPVRGTMGFLMGPFGVEVVTREGLPPIIVFLGQHHEKTIEDLAGSMRTYLDYFGPYPFRSLLAVQTSQLEGHSFPGLVLLPSRVLHSAETELLRAHEVAHQWWGASVDWEHYRDQWIPEGFANYSAALYLLAGLQREDAFVDVLDAWRRDVLGEISAAQEAGLRRYGHSRAVLMDSDGHESGPVVAGYRLRTRDTPLDHRLLVYEKGAFILHMIRMLLLDLETGDDGRFKELMRGFAGDNAGGVASTRSFEAAVAKAFGEPMDWFFDQWGLRRRRADLPSGPRRLAGTGRGDAVRRARDRAPGGRAARLPDGGAHPAGVPRPRADPRARLGRGGGSGGGDPGAGRARAHRVQLPARRPGPREVARPYGRVGSFADARARPARKRALRVRWEFRCAKARPARKRALRARWEFR